MSSRDLRGGLAARLAWLATDDRNAAAAALTIEKIAVGADRSGNRTKKVGAGVQTGRAFAWVEPGEWGGLDFLASDAMVGEQDAKLHEVYLKNDRDTRTVGIQPWRETGDKANIRTALPMEGLVVRGSKIGPQMELEQVFFPARAVLVSHHRDEEPPINSTPIHDPGHGDGDWVAGLHGIERNRPFLRSFCQGATSTGDDGPFFAALLNFTRSAGDNSGWGAAHFAKNEAVLSAEAFGFAHPCNDGNHDLGLPDHPEAMMVQEGGLHITRTKFGNTDAGIIYSPAEFVNSQWKNGGKGAFFRRVEWREDHQSRHATRCGTAEGLKRWMSWDSFREYPPPSEPPETPPEDPPNPPTVPPVYPSPIYLPYEGRTRPSTATPNEIESPSEYGHPIPDGPDAPGDTDWPEGGHSSSGPNYATLTDEQNDHWSRVYNFSERAWHERAPISSHGIAFNQYENATANAGPERWTPVKSHLEQLSFDNDGWITGREAALGPGGKMYAAPELQLHNLYTGINAELPTTANDFLLGVFAAKDSAGTVYDGRLGIGALTPDSAFIASGWELKLRYDGAGGITNPDLDIVAKNASGAESAGGAVVKINGSAIGSGSGDVSGPGASVVGNLPSWADTGGTLLDDSGIAAEDVYRAGGTDVPIADGGTGASTAAGARTNFGLGTMAVVNSPVPLANGGTGSTTADGAINELINNATSDTTLSPSDELMVRTSLVGRASTLQAVFNTIDGLTAETAPVAADKLPLYDASGTQTDAVTYGNLFGEGKAVVIQYTGSGSSGKTVTLTGINRCHAILAYRYDSGTAYSPRMYFPDGSTGAINGRYFSGTATATFSFDAPAAGTSQVLTINETGADINGSGGSYRILVVGTPI